MELREHLPDVLEELLAVGGLVLPMTAELGEPQPGDEDLKVLIVRRTTFEWVLRQAARAQPGVRFLTGATVTGLMADAGDGPPVVTGVQLGDGTCLEADVVVASTGLRGDLPGWLAALGVDVPETVHESGLMYLSRWYRLPESFAAELDPKLGGDLGFVKYLGVPGDAGTLSITLADTARRRDAAQGALRAGAFERACRLLPGPDQFFRQGPLDPVGGVRPMGGLRNRVRTFVDGDGRPLVLGFHAVGDAHTCTNPLYGRGCSLALVQALLLAGALADHPGDADARAVAYEAACGARYGHGSTRRSRWTGPGPIRTGALGGTSPEGRRSARSSWPRHRPGHRAGDRPVLEPAGHAARPHGRSGPARPHGGGHGQSRRLPRPGPAGPSRAELLEHLDLKEAVA